METRLSLVREVNDGIDNLEHVRQSRATGRMTRIGEHLEVKSPIGPPPPELTWECSVCGLIEPLPLPSGNRWIRRSCECERAARKLREDEELRAAWRVHQSYRTFGGWLGNRWITNELAVEMSRKRFNTWDSKRFPKAYITAYQFACEPRGNLVLYGSFGTGKTHLEAAILNSLRDEQGITSLFASAPQFFTAYQDSMRAADKTREISLMQQIIETPVLVLDDVDKLKPSEFRHETYWLILDERYKARRPTVISTNKMETLGEYIGDASVSRLQRGLVSVKMVGSDYRMEEDEQ